MNRFFIFLLTLFVMIINRGISFAEAFYFDNYEVYIKVKENGNYEIIEDTEIFFKYPRHGIIREIPTEYTLSYPDGKTAGRWSKVEKVSVEEKIGDDYKPLKFETFKSGRNFEIKIGSASKTIKGKQNVRIKYDYLNQKDSNKGFDEFYFNVIGTQWATNINKAAFRIDMPFEFDARKVGISIGKYGTEGFKDRAEYHTDGKTIYLSTKQPLEPNEGITVRIELPDNYFTHEETKNILGIVSLVLALLSAIISYIVWSVYGKDDAVIPVVSFKPPEGKNGAQIGAEYKGNAGEKELVGLLIELAVKGYIKIKNQPPYFTLEKLKNYDGNNTYEKKFMNILFKSKNTVKKRDLEYSKTFYKECEDLISDLREETKNIIYENNSSSPLKVLLLFGCMILCLFLSIFALADYSISAVFSLVNEDNVLWHGCTIGSLIFFALYFEAKTDVKSKVLISAGVSLVFLFGLSMLYISNTDVFFSPDFKVAIFCLIMLAANLCCLANLRKHTKYGIKSFGEIEGFKKFIEVAEKDKIETLSKDDPEYGYKLLPYAFVLGAAKTWLDKFEGIIQKPSWYDGSFDNSDILSFADSFGRITRPSESNGGISNSSGGSFSTGGGGFSGGGGGGGGGHSW